MSYQDILFKKDGPIAIITLNRPDKLNAFPWVVGNETSEALT